MSSFLTSWCSSQVCCSIPHTPWCITSRWAQCLLCTLRKGEKLRTCMNFHSLQWPWDLSLWSNILQGAKSMHSVQPRWHIDQVLKTCMDQQAGVLHLLLLRFPPVSKGILVPKMSMVACPNDYRPVALTLEWSASSGCLLRKSTPASEITNPFQFAYRHIRSTADALSLTSSPLCPGSFGTQMSGGFSLITAQHSIQSSPPNSSQSSKTCCCTSHCKWIVSFKRCRSVTLSPPRCSTKVHQGE